jgi:DNA invertase Pin-like site-specific DNA recombinase
MTTSAKRKTVALYLRVSTDEQTTRNQERPLRDWARRMNWNVVRVYKDKGISGAKSSRPALSQMLRDAKHGMFNTVLIARIDRLARSLSHLLWVVQELDRLGIALKDLNTGFDLETSTGRLTLGILGSIAQFERDLIIERTKAGIARARAEGKHCGRPSKKLDVA